MISFSRKEKSLKVEIKSGLSPQDSVYVLTWNCNDECYADLLQHHLNGQLEKRIENIRRESYHHGWKDAKAHNKKETWFSRWF